jgi:2,5-diamino-6-(ribosylamino)-4(3H)-pyrimidinone 5'-phosphate reductase
MARPFVVINVAASLDGKIDTIERRGAPISSERDRDRVDQLRAASDAVMVGSRTLHDEDPRLTVRSSTLQADRVARGEPANPAKVAVATRLGLKPDARFLSAGPARIILFTARTAVDAALGHGLLTAQGVEIYPTDGPQVDLATVMAKLVELGIRRVLVEGGGSLNFELLRLGLVDEVQLYLAPTIFGGATAPTLADGAGLLRADAVALERVQVEPWQDGGLVLRYKVKPR